MITLQEVLQLHENSIRDYGGSSGIRDLGLLESAMARPFQSFGDTEFYPTIFEKAAAFLESIVKNHPFIDGNKRTGWLAAFAFVYENNFEVTASNNAVYDLVINVASSQISFEGIVEWLQQNSVPLEP